MNAWDSFIFLTGNSSLLCSLFQSIILVWSLSGCFSCLFACLLREYSAAPGKALLSISMVREKGHSCRDLWHSTWSFWFPSVPARTNQARFGPNQSVNSAREGKEQHCHSSPCSPGQKNLRKRGTSGEKKQSAVLSCVYKPNNFLRDRICTVKHVPPTHMQQDLDKSR